MLIALSERQITITLISHHLCNIFPHFILILQSSKEILGDLSYSSSYSTVCILEQCEPDPELKPGLWLSLIIQPVVNVFSMDTNRPGSENRDGSDVDVQHWSLYSCRKRVPGALILFSHNVYRISHISLHIVSKQHCWDGTEMMIYFMPWQYKDLRKQEESSFGEQLCYLGSYDRQDCCDWQHRKSQQIAVVKQSSTKSPLPWRVRIG